MVMCHSQPVSYDFSISEIINKGKLYIWEVCISGNRCVVPTSEGGRYTLFFGLVG